MINPIRKGSPLIFRSSALVAVLLLAIVPTFSTSFTAGGFSEETRGRDLSEGEGLLEEHSPSFHLSGSNQGSWQQRFERVHDALELRVGGPGGVLITWPDRGLGGRYTWSFRDPVEVRDIGRWVGAGGSVRLWGRIIQLPNGTGDRQCSMDTLYNGSRRQRWEFSGDEIHDISSN